MERNEKVGEPVKTTGLVQRYKSLQRLQQGSES